MIKEDTLFILGAGASMAYGFPSAQDLRMKIIGEFRDSYIPIHKTMNKHELGYDHYEEEERVEKFIKQYEGTPRKFTIDDFLKYNTEYKKLGKSAIILNLLNEEKDSNFDERSKEIESDWYSHLIIIMMPESYEPDSYKELSNNRVEFITFNYERSLEYYLLDRIKRIYNNNYEKEIAEQLKHIKIHHVYGKLGPLYPFGNVKQDCELEYGHDVSFPLLVELLDNIKIIENYESAKKFQEIIKGKKRIFILGFSFDDNNLKNLGIEEVITLDQKIYATTKGLNSEEVEKIEYRFFTAAKRNSYNKTMGPTEFHNLFFEDSNCLELVEKYL